MGRGDAGRAPFYLGIDLGGTNIKSGVVDDDGRPCSSVSIETNADRGGEAGLRSLATAGRAAVEQSGLSWDEIAAVGLGSPGTMDLPSGMLLEPPNLPGWENFPIRERLAAELKKPTLLQNDANAAAFGEYWVGAGKGVHSLVLFTLGTGVGGGIIVDDHLVEGRHSHGSECGHIIVQMENGRRCPCGQFGHLEAYASATSLVQRALEALQAGEESSLRGNLANDTLSAHAINSAAEAGDSLGRRLMHETARYLAVGAASLMHTIDPDIVLFSGGMIAAGPKFLDQIRQHVQLLAFPTCAAKTRIDYATLGGNAGFIGAAGCARQAWQEGRLSASQDQAPST